jgi:hypothetical protein
MIPLMRNHLVESQVRDLSWPGEDDGRPDTDVSPGPWRIAGHRPASAG